MRPHAVCMSMILVLALSFSVPATGQHVDAETSSEDEKADALKEYARNHYRTAPVQITYFTNGIPTGASMDWTVIRGGRTAVTAMEFSAAMGDETVVLRLKREKAAGGVFFGALLGGGAPLVIGGIVALEQSKQYHDEWDELLWEDDPDYDRMDEIEALESYYSGLGLVLVSAGGMMMAISWLPALIVDQKQKWPSRYYTTDEADDLTDQYNDELREELGLSKQDVLNLDLYGERPAIEIRPVFSATYVGIAGRF